MGLDSKEIKCLIFDLDDTLFDTFGLLVQPATREACLAMINAGLNATLEDCLEERKKIWVHRPRQNVYSELVRIFGTKENRSPNVVAQAGFDAFHDREVKEEIKPFGDAKPTLEALREKFHISLVTLGTPKTQIKKVELLKLGPLFHSVTYVNVAREKSKTGAFEEVMSKFPKLGPRAFVSIGNRIDSDIRNAKELGMQAILMAHGEYAHLHPQDSLEKPDAQISKLAELLDILQ